MDPRGDAKAKELGRKLLAAKGNFKDARAEAQKSYDLGAKAGNGFFLEAEVKKALADWSKKT